MGFAVDEERLGDLLHPPRSAEGFRAWAKEQAVAKSDSDCFGLAVEALDTGQIVGAVGSRHADPRAGWFEYGITMGAGHRRKGYAAEAVAVSALPRKGACAITFSSRADTMIWSSWAYSPTSSHRCTR